MTGDNTNLLNDDFRKPNVDVRGLRVAMVTGGVDDHPRLFARGGGGAREQRVAVAHVTAAAGEQQQRTASEYHVLHDWLRARSLWDTWGC